MAVPLTNTSGTICKNYNAEDANFIDYVPNGTRSFKNGVTQLICPLTRDTRNTNGAVVYVDLTHYSNTTTTCAAYSFSSNGILLASNSATFTGTGFRELSIPLNGSGKAGTRSDYSVLCEIPGNTEGLIMGVDLSEL